MTIQRAIKVGDLITVGKSGQHQLVVRAERHRTDGVHYVDEFDTIDAEVFYGSDRKSSADPKVTAWYLDGCTMHGKGQSVSRSEIKIVGTAKVKAKVRVTYDWFNIRYFKTAK